MQFDFDEDGFSPTNEPAFSFNWIDFLLILGVVVLFTLVAIKLV